MIRVAVPTIIAQALKEMNYIASGEAVQPELSVDGLELLNQIFDDWNAERGMIYADVFQRFTLPTNTNPVTIGPAGNLVFAQPPVSIEGIQIILTGSTPIPYIYCRKRDRQWWQAQPSPTVTASYPTDFYYDNAWSETAANPNGSIYFFPVNTTAYDVQLWMRKLLAQVTAATTLGLPPGYSYAMRMELAYRWHSALRKPWTSDQETARQKALTQIVSNNNEDPVRIATRDAGMPNGGGGNLPNFFWPSGLLR